MKIEVLGDGCTKCKDLRNKVQQAVYELNLPSKVTSIMDPEQLTHLEALSLPQLNKKLIFASQVVTNKKAPYSKQGAFLWDIPNLSSFNPPIQT